MTLAHKDDGLTLSVVFDRVEFFLNIVNQMCIGFVTIYITWFCFNLGINDVYELHIWLVTLGFSLIMAEATMCHYDNNALTLNYKRKTKTTIHWVLQLCGGGCGVAGVLIICIHYNFVFKDTHGRVGFATFILCIVSMLTGLTALVAKPLKKVFSPLLNKAFHNLLGVATFVLALIAQYYGYNYLTPWLAADYIVLLKCLTLLSLVLTCIGPLKAMYHKISTMMGH